MGCGLRRRLVRRPALPVLPTPTHIWQDYANDPLHARLEARVLPTCLVLLRRLPCTPNGKIDRQALPEPVFPVLDEQDFLAPRTPTQQTLARIWGEVPGLERVGLHHNYFTLGGDSIRSIQIVTLARNAGLHQTIAELAEAVSHQETPGQESDPPTPDDAPAETWPAERATPLAIGRGPLPTLPYAGRDAGLAPAPPATRTLRYPPGLPFRGYHPGYPGLQTRLAAGLCASPGSSRTFFTGSRRSDPCRSSDALLCPKLRSMTCRHIRKRNRSGR